LRAQREDLPIQVLALARRPDDRAQLVEIEILRDVVIRAVLDGLDGGFYLADLGDHDDLHETVVLPDDLQDLEAADARQRDVEQDDINLVLVQHTEGCFAGRDPEHPKLALQDRSQRIPHALVVIDDEDGSSASGHRKAWSGDCRRRLTLLQAVR
jgi:hypothetical protein